VRSATPVTRSRLRRTCTSACTFAGPACAAVRAILRSSCANENWVTATTRQLLPALLYRGHPCPRPCVARPRASLPASLRVTPCSARLGSHELARRRRSLIAKLEAVVSESVRCRGRPRLDSRPRLPAGEPSVESTSRRHSTRGRRSAPRAVGRRSARGSSRARLSATHAAVSGAGSCRETARPRRDSAARRTRRRRAQHRAPR
jgi:hypothetical protein